MFSFKTNGRDVRVDVPPDTPLLWVLREELQLAGTKFGCGKGLCGACTVHLDGEATRSCGNAFVAKSTAWTVPPAVVTRSRPREGRPGRRATGTRIGPG